jgi:hypothetical protein
VNTTVPGQLRWSKGAWLFRPDVAAPGDDAPLLRVQPVPAPETAGFRAARVVARLQVTAHAVERSAGPAGLAPRTGIPTTLRGVVVGRDGGALVVDVGFPVVVVVGAGEGDAPVGAGVVVDVDVDAGVRCLL